MFETLDLNRLSHALARHSTARLAVIAENMAQADTPGYRVKDLAPFAAGFEAVELRHTRPGHVSIGASSTAVTAVSGEEAPNGNSVSREQEMMKAVVTRQSFDMALAVSRANDAILRTAFKRSG